MSERLPVDGPHRIVVDAIPGGVALDVSHYLHGVIVALGHAAREDAGLLDELIKIAELDAEAHGSDSHAGHERDELVEALLAEIGDGVLPVYGAQVARLAARLSDLSVPRAVEGPQGVAA